jgi:hypothetical protein
MAVETNRKRNSTPHRHAGLSGHPEVVLWVLALVVVLLIGAPLVLWSASQARLHAPEAAKSAPVAQAKAGPSTSATAREKPPWEPVVPAQPPKYSETTIEALSRGSGVLNLGALAQAHSVGESDNARWSLVRRTPAAATVFKSGEGVDWAALRNVTTSGTILMPAGFAWSFNETFRGGPGYKEAGGILAGGHCALASAFQKAASQAALPTAFQQHATPIPGFSAAESVNILWGRDDLVVHNTSQQELFFVWHVTPNEVRVDVVPVGDAFPLAELPDWRQATVALTYGRPGPGGWGTLGQGTIVDLALYLARSFATSVDEWNGDKATAVAVNPNVVMVGEIADRDLFYYQLIAEARRQGYYVMLDIQPGSQDPLALLNTLMDKFLQENVWFDWDIEHTVGGQANADHLNRVAQAYFARRQAEGYQTPGIFGFYVFKDNQVLDPQQVQRTYDNGVVVPIFDGFGGGGAYPGAEKIAKTTRVLAPFGNEDVGVMEFETRWGTRYDKISAHDYFNAFPNALIFASQ